MPPSATEPPSSAGHNSHFQLPPPILEDPTSEDDIYRGYEAPLSAEPDTPRRPDVSHPQFVLPSIASSSSSSSSTSSEHGGLGAIAALVERAITRWARGTSSASSSSSSTSSTSSSSSDSRTRSRARSFSTKRGRQKRRGSIATVNTHELSPSRIARARQILEDSRRLPKEFTLLLPPSLTNLHPYAIGKPSEHPRLIRTSSSKIILTYLETTLRRHGRRNQRRPRMERERSGRIAATTLGPHVGDHVVSRHAPKGKSKVLPTPSESQGVPRPRPHRTEGSDPSNRTWWLDVASPTWEDMKAFGKLLHLHPLTLEDIVQQETREKLEVFPRLGYYFVVFRAAESHRGVTQGKALTEAVLAVTVYLVVFRDGICSFHFEDISEHADRVRNRILQLETTIQWTPDWVAHGLMDSIVDGFFPIVESIEDEVEELDSLVSGLEAGTKSKLTTTPKVTHTAKVPLSLSTEKGVDDEPSSSSTVDGGSSDMEKAGARPSEDSQTVPSHPTFLSRFPCLNWSTNLLARFVRLKVKSRSKTGVSQTTPGQDLLLRIASSRRLVTALSRILVPKNEVVAQIRKRLRMTGRLIGVGQGAIVQSSEAFGTVELDIYLGDLQDHIVTLQQSLAHYERILSHSHPTYTSNLQYTLLNAKGGIGRAILLLTSVSICCLAMQFITGLMSMNIHVPQNRKRDDDKGISGGQYYAFGGVLSFVTCELIGLECPNVAPLGPIAASAPSSDMTSEDPP
ncbi:hypothetical protein FRB99_004382 [Tulasnella sp. 403]|nr:hypothetical protein FRB99_004382 [Tulasnella sp. 403]